MLVQKQKGILAMFYLGSKKEHVFIFRLNIKNILIILLAVFLISCQPSAEKQPVELVYPLLDAANSRWFYFSSACRPFGMISLFPDTEIEGAWNSGYRYNTDTIRDFSHIHEWQLSGVSVMPVSFKNKNINVVFDNWSSAFSHNNEIVKPGYHSVFLDRYHIKAELTASNRVGFHRYTYSRGEDAGVIIQLCGQLGPSEISEGAVVRVNKYEIRGYMINGPTFRRPKQTPVYFCVVFNRPIKEIRVFNGEYHDSLVNQWSGKNRNVLLLFGQIEEKPLMMKVGISYTSENGAASNLQAELPSWDFDETVAAAREHWNNMLSRIEIEGGTEQQQRRFYTDLWHAIQGRRIMSDVDGTYTDMTGTEIVIRQVPLDNRGNPLFHMYNSDAFWGAQWTLNTLWQLVYPEIAGEFCNSFIEYYKNGGLIPRGPSGGNYTFVMNGASSTPFFVSAWQKGIRGFDMDTAYKALKKNHFPGGLMAKVGYEHETSKGGGIEFYIKNGYVPYPLSDTIYGSHQDGAGITLENAYQDWCLAQLAKSLGKNDDYEMFMKRSENFRNIYNKDIGYMVPRDKNGTWESPYDPLLYDNGFIESNGAQATWFVPHNLTALFTLMGGADSAIKRLNFGFEASRQYRFCNEHPENEEISGSKFVNNRRTWINYSNQPNSQAAFIFNYAGVPWLTQYWSRTVVDNVFSALSPFYGYNGDEDQGLMGSLAVLMKIGIFQMTGGCEKDPMYELGSPVFDEITIHLNRDYYNSGTFKIITKNNKKNTPYIQTAKLNGKPFNSCFFRHSDIAHGAKIELEMGEIPNKNWGIEKGMTKY